MRSNLNNKSYNRSFKENAIQQLLLPNSLGLSQTARKIGIPPSTLYGWKKKCVNTVDMKKTNNNIAKNWTPEQKLDAIIKTATMGENELGEYLRTNGLHSDDLIRFKNDLISSSQERGRPKLDTEVVELRKQNKLLERDVKRKDKALAEYSARVILLKKSHEIWGEPEEEELPNLTKK